jgi:ABC-type lipoprotein release transport system permease subunit
VGVKASIPRSYLRRAVSRLLPVWVGGLAVAAAAQLHSAPAGPQVLLSRQLMAQGGVRVGDVVTLATDPQGARATRFVVAGVYEPTPNPLKFSARRLEARLHLPDLLALTDDPGDPLASESVTALNLSLVNARDADRVTATIAARSPGLMIRPTASPSAPGETFAVINRFHSAIAIVTVVGSTAFLLALMVIRAEERRDIVGILRLMGIPPRSILAEVLLEGVLIAAAGTVFGIVVALLGQSAINRFFQWRYDTTLVFVRVTFPIVCESMAFALPLGVLAGLAASWTLLRRDVISLIGR